MRPGDRITLNKNEDGSDDLVEYISVKKVAAALGALRAKMDFSGGELRETDYWIDELDATIARLGLMNSDYLRRKENNEHLPRNIA